MAIEKVKQVRFAPDHGGSLRSWAAHTGEAIDIVIPSLFLNSRINIHLCLRSFPVSEYPHQLFWGLRIKVALSSRLEDTQAILAHVRQTTQNIGTQISQIAFWNFAECPV